MLFYPAHVGPSLILGALRDPAGPTPSASALLSPLRFLGCTQGPHDLNRRRRGIARGEGAAPTSRFAPEGSRAHTQVGARTRPGVREVNY